MIPEKGTTVLIVFRNGIQLEGEVIVWTEKQSILKSLSGKSDIVINKTSEDVMFFKIFGAKKEYQEIKDKTRKEPTDIKNLAELKKDLNELELAETREKLNTHIPSGYRETEYVSQRNIKIKSPVNPIREEAPREASGFSAELQNMFSKKH